ncbi:hypothetical protein NE237_004907 [Protea cynaroides]|uniref:Uncharacterized protein n=1 Tax=Protea cynaroides TaxID=273540 RepID=A0A9Q0KJH1_9MAGN|nr:hypothetical protein NE237_004907 [Protea cynaroides]
MVDNLMSIALLPYILSLSLARSPSPSALAFLHQCLPRFAFLILHLSLSRSPQFLTHALLLSLFHTLLYGSRMGVVAGSEDFFRSLQNLQFGHKKVLVLLSFPPKVLHFCALT